MAERFVSRGFVGKRRAGSAANRVPPGQQIRPDFPVLSAGPTPKVDLNKWTFTIEGLVKKPITWSWQEFLKLPRQNFVSVFAVEATLINSPYAVSHPRRRAASRFALDSRLRGNDD